jgi:hypothetical protein
MTNQSPRWRHGLGQEHKSELASDKYLAPAAAASTRTIVRP